jgi:hypothetical protein
VSDFDDEPLADTEAGIEANDEPADAAPPKEPAPNARPKPAPDDDWDDDWDDEDDRGRGGKRDLTLVYAIVAAAIVIVLAVVLTRPKDDNSGSDANNGNAAATTAPAAPDKNWQGPVGDAVGKDGADAQKRAESETGFYIWTDFGGWHVRQNGNATAVLKVTAPQVRVDGKGAFAAEATAPLPAGNGSKGVELDLGNSETATFSITVDGTDVPAEQIFLGGGEGVADASPVTFTKS